MEHYAGIDEEESSVCIVDATGRIIREVKIASVPEALVRYFDELELSVIRIGLETGPLSQWLHAGLVAVGRDAILFETRHVKAALSAMTVKTDRKDARGIAQLLRMRSYRPVHAKSVTCKDISCPMMRMSVPPSWLGQRRSWRATRHLLIRARSASGKVARGRPCNELGLSTHGLLTACLHLRALGAPRPGWAHHKGRSKTITAGRKGTADHIPDNGKCEWSVPPSLVPGPCFLVGGSDLCIIRMEGAHGVAPIYSETLRQFRMRHATATAFVVSAALKSGRI